MTAPGWYHGQGDPPNTHRYWDGTTWIGEPVMAPTAPPAAPPPKLAWRRFTARAIDLVVGGVILALIISLDTGVPDFGRDDINLRFTIGRSSLDAPSEYFIWGIVAFLWSTVWLTATGTTLGKSLLGLAVIDVAATDQATRAPLRFGKAALRSANKLIPAVGMISRDAGELAVLIVGMALLGITSVVMVLISPHRTPLDRIARTRVIRPVRRA